MDLSQRPLQTSGKLFSNFILVLEFLTEKKNSRKPKHIKNSEA